MKNYKIWFNRQSQIYTRNYEDLFRKILDIGYSLTQKKYIGYDVNVRYPAKLISTVLSLSLVGWLNLFSIEKNEEYLQYANNCIDQLLTHQLDDGSWLFPYAFRNNPPEFPYSCENFMTVRPLIYALDFPINNRNKVRAAVRKNLSFLIENIGYQDGLFWYSKSDHIEVPNISSMASNTFAHASALFRDKGYLDLAYSFAKYCIKNQADDGSYPYFANQSMVYIPYHALEIWELIEANEFLKLNEVESSVENAISFLHNFIEKHGFYSKFPKKGFRHSILLKTYIWSAKASLIYGDIERGTKYYLKGLNKFLLPENDVFYQIKEYDLVLFSFQIPKHKTKFIRYLASLFEIGTILIRKMKVD